jgi:hypothetical protein
MLASLLMFAVGVGMVLVYYQRRAAIQRAESQFAICSTTPPGLPIPGHYAKILKSTRPGRSRLVMARRAIGHTFCEFLVPEHVSVSV